jgi:hypothetical protein
VGRWMNNNKYSFSPFYSPPLDTIDDGSNDIFVFLDFTNKSGKTSTTFENRPFFGRLDLILAPASDYVIMTS